MGLVSAVRLGILGALSAAVAACSVQVSTGTPSGGGPYGGSGGPPDLSGEDSGPPATVSAGSTTPSATPMLATVDTNVTMNASPGEGVGVFSEYDTGGHWHLWWTCDTDISNQSCPFDVTVSAVTGTITNASSDQFAPSDMLITPSTPASGESGEIEAKTVTTVASEGVLFDTDPGATITVTATIGGLYNGRFLFWVQGGKVDDGYRGTVSDPLMLVGASP
jgi:hypothetical protein